MKNPLALQERYSNTILFLYATNIRKSNINRNIKTVYISHNNNWSPICMFTITEKYLFIQSLSNAKSTKNLPNKSFLTCRISSLKAINISSPKNLDKLHTITKKLSFMLIIPFHKQKKTKNLWMSSFNPQIAT